MIEFTQTLGDGSAFLAGLTMGALLEPVIRILIRNSAADAAGGYDDRVAITGFPALSVTPPAERGDTGPHSAGGDLLGPARDSVGDSAAALPRSNGEWRTAVEHAEALADWLLEAAPAGLAGETLTARELIEIYGEMCAERGWAVRPWQPVAVALMRRLECRKAYEWRAGQRVRVYTIPNGIAESARTTLAHAAEPNRARRVMAIKAPVSGWCGNNSMKVAA